MPRGGFTPISGSRRAERSSHGRCRRRLQLTLRTSGSRCGPRTTRSSSRTSKARSPRVNTEPARSPCGMRDLRPDQGQCRAGTPVAEAAERGHLTVLLHGHKLIGGCALTRIGPAGERWLLVKEADEYAGKTPDPRPHPAAIAEHRPPHPPTHPATA